MGSNAARTSGWIGMVGFGAVLLRQKQVSATRSSFASDEQRQRRMNLSPDVLQ